MNIVHVSTAFGIGGFDASRLGENVTQVVTAETDEAGSWWVVTRDGHGELLDSREATEAESVSYELTVNPPPAPDPAPEWSAFVGTLTAEQRSALALALGSA